MGRYKNSHRKDGILKDDGVQSILVRTSSYYVDGIIDVSDRVFVFENKYHSPAYILCDDYESRPKFEIKYIVNSSNWYDGIGVKRMSLSFERNLHFF